MTRNFVIGISPIDSVGLLVGSSHPARYWRNHLGFDRFLLEELIFEYVGDYLSEVMDRTNFQLVKGVFYRPYGQ